jgi:hypothetical protein
MSVQIDQSRQNPPSRGANFKISMKVLSNLKDLSILNLNVPEAGAAIRQQHFSAFNDHSIPSGHLFLAAFPGAFGGVRPPGIIGLFQDGKRFTDRCIEHSGPGI